MLALPSAASPASPLTLYLLQREVRHSSGLLLPDALRSLNEPYLELALACVAALPAQPRARLALD